MFIKGYEESHLKDGEKKDKKKMKIKMEVKLKRVSLREKFEYPSLKTEKISSKQLNTYSINLLVFLVYVII